MTTSVAEGCSEKAAYWTKHIAFWHKSGLSQRAYCQRHGLSQSSLSYWQKRLGATDEVGVGSFVTIVPVPLLASAQVDMPIAPEPLLVHVGAGFCIEIRGDFAAPVLEKLIRTLTQL